MWLACDFRFICSLYYRATLCVLLSSAVRLSVRLSVANVRVLYADVRPVSRLADEFTTGLAQIAA